MNIKTIGIIGAGKLGTALAKLALEAGFEVLISSRDSQSLKLIMASILPDAKLVPLDQLLSHADITILAIPHNAVLSVDLSKAKGIVIDATNPWEATGTAKQSHSLLDLSEKYPHVPFAKSLNHFSYEDLLSSYRPVNSTKENSDSESTLPRRAISVLASNDLALEGTFTLIRKLGFDPVQISVKHVPLFLPDGKYFGAWLSKDEMKELLDKEN